MLSDGSIKLLVVCKIGSVETGYKKITLKKTIGICLELSYRYTPGEIKIVFYKYVRITGCCVGNRSGYLPNTCLEEFHYKAPTVVLCLL
jgi:hypothetical protein